MKRIVNGKIVKIAHLQYIKTLVTMNHATSNIMDLHHTVIAIKILIVTFQIKFPTNLVVNVINVPAKTLPLSKIFTV